MITFFSQLMTYCTPTMHTYTSYHIVQKLQRLPNDNTIIPNKNNNILILCNVQSMIQNWSHNCSPNALHYLQIIPLIRFWFSAPIFTEKKNIYILMRKEACCRQFCLFKVVRQVICVYQYTLGVSISLTSWVTLNMRKYLLSAYQHNAYKTESSL